MSSKTQASLISALWGAGTTRRGCSDADFVLVNKPSKELPPEMVTLDDLCPSHFFLDPVDTDAALNAFTRSSSELARGEPNKGQYYAKFGASVDAILVHIKPKSRDENESCRVPYVGLRFQTNQGTIEKNINATFENFSGSLAGVLKDPSSEGLARLRENIVNKASSGKYDCLNSATYKVLSTKRGEPPGPGRGKAAAKVPRVVGAPNEGANPHVAAQARGADIVAANPGTAALMANAGAFIADNFPNLLSRRADELTPKSKGARTLALASRTLGPLVKAYNYGLNEGRKANAGTPAAVPNAALPVATPTQLAPELENENEEQ